MFNESIENIYKIFFDECYTERRLATDTIKEVDIGSAQSVNSPKNLKAADQTAAGLNAPDKTINISRFDKLNVKKYFVEIHGYRYLRNKVLTNFPENDYIDQ